MRLPLFPCVLAAALGLAPAASAQATFGLRAGLNVADVSFSGIEDDEFFDDFKEPRLGLVAGVMADVPLSPQLSFHPEVLYSQKGFKLDIEIEVQASQGTGEGSLTYQLDYLEVPLLLAYRIPVGQNGLTVGLEAGPTVAYLLSTGLSCSGDFESTCDENEQDLDDDFESLDIGGALGVSVGAGPFAADLRFTQGFTSIANSEEGSDGEARNRVFSVAARYAFGR